MPILPAEDNAGNIRLFIAVSLPPNVKKSIGDLSVRLQKGMQFTGAHPTWVKPDLLHITMAFLGWQKPDRVDDAKAAMNAAAPSCVPITLSAGGVELFPDWRNPRVIAMGLHGAIPQLSALYKCLGDECRARGFEVDERPFRPHLTLARIKSQKGLAGVRDLAKSHEKVTAGSFEVHSLDLYQSVLQPEGPTYTLLATVPLTT